MPSHPYARRPVSDGIDALRCAGRASPRPPGRRRGQCAGRFARPDRGRALDQARPLSRLRQFRLARLHCAQLALADRRLQPRNARSRQDARRSRAPRLGDLQGALRTVPGRSGRAPNRAEALGDLRSGEPVRSECRQSREDARDLRTLHGFQSIRLLARRRLQSAGGAEWRLYAIRRAHQRTGIFGACASRLELGPEPARIQPTLRTCR